MTLTVTNLIQELLMDSTLTNKDIARKVLIQFPSAKTTEKSVASVASVARRFGVAIPKRTNINSADTILIEELQAKVIELEMIIAEMNATKAA